MKKILIFSGLMVCLMACAGFNYRYYGLDPVSYEGHLYAHDPAMDRPLEDCKPSNGNKVKCFVFFRDEIERLLADYADKENRIKYYEKNCKLP